MSSSISVRIPAGVVPGERITFTRNGQEYAFLAPAGATPGTVILVNTPVSTPPVSTPPLQALPLQALPHRLAPADAESASASMAKAGSNAPPLGSYSDSDEIAIRELLIQRCLEVCRLHGNKSNYKDMSTVIRGEFGEKRFQRYKSLVEYHMKRHALSLQQKESKRLRESTPRGSESKLELPRLVACLGGCGFWGNPDTKNLCNKCFSNLVQKDVKHITREQAVQDMLRKLGFSSLEDYMVDLAFARRFPGEAQGDELRQELPGMRKWFNSSRPITQFDKAPEKGTTACTYISGVTALRALLRDEFAVTPSAWADCILRGVVAFHAAARTDPRLKGHSHICEAMPYVLEVLGCTTADAQRFTVRERVVLLYLDPVFEGSQPSDILGPAYADGVGKEGLVPTLRMALEQSQALVITRPPETWAVTRELDENEMNAGSGGSGTVRMRDSHRRAQLDFDSVDDFLSWVAIDRAFFASVPSTGIDMNSVSVSWFVEQGSPDAAAFASGSPDIAPLAPATKGSEAMPVPPTISSFQSQGLMKIMDRLFITSYSLACSRDMLLCHNFTHIINVSPSATEGEDLHGPSCPNAYPAEFRYCNIPIEDPLGEDFPAANEAALSFIKMLESVAEYLRATLASEPPVGVLVHSNDEDKSVVPALIMAFLIIHHQCTLSAAYALLEERMPDVCPSFAAFQALVAIEKNARGGKTSMSIDECSADIIMSKITDMGFDGVNRENVLASVKKYGPRIAQQRMLNECLGVDSGPG